MATEFLRELKVTETDLSWLKSNWRPYVRLSCRQQQIIDAAPDDGLLLFLDRHAAWRAWSGTHRESGVIYRLHQDLELPPEKPKPEKPKMNIFWLTDLNVTEDELRTLQNNWRALDGLSEREKLIIRAAKKCGCVYIMYTDGTFGGTSSNETVYPGHVYRLHPELNMNYMFSNCTSLDAVLGTDVTSVTNMNYMFQNYSSLDDLVVSGWDTSSAEKPKRDPRKPFKHTIDGKELWCCPVYPDDERLTFTRPGTNGGYLVTGAANYVDFAGICGAEEDGMPTGYMEHDVSIALAYHHENGGDQQVAFVCFETGDK